MARNRSASLTTPTNVDSGWPCAASDRRHALRVRRPNATRRAAACSLARCPGLQRTSCRASRPGPQHRRTAALRRPGLIRLDSSRSCHQPAGRALGWSGSPGGRYQPHLNGARGVAHEHPPHAVRLQHPRALVDAAAHVHRDEPPAHDVAHLGALHVLAELHLRGRQARRRQGSCVNTTGHITEALLQLCRAISSRAVGPPPRSACFARALAARPPPRPAFRKSRLVMKPGASAPASTCVQERAAAWPLSAPPWPYAPRPQHPAQLQAAAPTPASRNAAPCATPIPNEAYQQCGDVVLLHHRPRHAQVRLRTPPPPPHSPLLSAPQPAPLARWSPSARPPPSWLLVCPACAATALPGCVYCSGLVSAITALIPVPAERTYLLADGARGLAHDALHGVGAAHGRPPREGAVALLR
jgi:hypothetical protein